MDLNQMLAAWRERLTLVFALALFGLAAAVYPANRWSPTYVSTTQLFVSTPGTVETAAGALTNNSFATTRLASYVTLVGTEAIRARAADLLRAEGGPLPVGTTKADVVTGTVVLTITASATRPLDARRLADATATALTSYVTTVDRGASGSALVSLTVVQPAGSGKAGVNRVPFYLLAGLVTGSLVGLGLALVLKQLDQSVRSSDELAELTGAPVLGVVPLGRDGPAPDLLTSADVHAPGAEVFRQIRTNLAYVQLVRRPRSLLITSALPGEGKSVTAINLASVLATGGQRVLLVDADLRRPRVARYTGLEKSVGLTDVLIRRVTVQEAVRPWRPNVSILDSGPVPPNPSELLSAPEMAELVQTLEAAWDVVVIDSPPLLAVTDAAVLSRTVGGTVMVTRSGRASRDQVQMAVQALTSVGTSPMGCILNGVTGTSAEAARYGYFPEYQVEKNTRADLVLR